MIIITVVRDDLTGLARTIASILTQNLQDVVSKILIVDGLSTDGSQSYARRVSQECDSVELLTLPPNGIYDAMNQGLHHLTKTSSHRDEYVLFLNAGDYLMNGNGLRELSDGVSGTHWATGHANLIRFGSFPGYETPQLVYPDVQKPNPHEYWIPHQALATKLSDFKSIGFFNSEFKIASDYEFMGRFWEKFGPPHVLSEIIVCQVLNGMSNTRTLSAHHEKNSIAVRGGFKPVELSKKTEIKWWLKEYLYLRFPNLNTEVRDEKKISNELLQQKCHAKFLDTCPWCHFVKYSYSEKIYSWVR
jgi:glycosyltransferase involved in cell wall biosynthesis